MYFLPGLGRELADDLFFGMHLHEISLENLLVPLSAQ